jgi:hypothetical protein
MTDVHRSLGPPERERPGATASTGPIQKSADTTTDKPKPIAPPRLCSADTVAGLARRRQASQRMVLLECGHRDPLCRCLRPPLSEKQIDAAAAAAVHLLAYGCAPAFDIETLRALCKAGHHPLVDDLRGGGR